MSKRSLSTQLSFIEVKMETDLSAELCDAVSKNDLNTVIDLISKGANVNACSIYDKLPLNIAIKKEFIEIVEKLIEKGANIDVKIHHEDKDKTLVEYAMQQSNPDIVTLLVKKGATTILDDSNYEGTVLHYAAKNGALELVKTMIDKGMDVDTRTEGGSTPLHVAADYQRFEVVKYLCQIGADVNARNSRKSTPIFFAINRSDASLEIVKFLIDNGAEINVENDFYYTPLQISLKEKNLNVAEFLIEKGVDIHAIYSNTHYARRGLGGTLLHWAARDYNADDVIKFLIESGLDINATEKDGRTPLCLYVKHNHRESEMVKYFVEHGADLNNRGGGSPFYWACYMHDVSTQKLLIELGMDVNAPADSHDQMKAPLHIVRDLSVAKLLIDKGANVNITDIDGNTPLHYDHPLSIVKCLVENGAEINIKNHEGRTPLHTTNNFFVAQYLIQKGADVRATDFKGYTPLHLASDVFTAEYLIEHGADINAITIDGKTVLHGIAELDTTFDVRYKGIPNVVRFFLEKGINVNVTDKNGNTPLHLCCTANSYYTLFQLLEEGADISATNNEGKTPEDCNYGMCIYTLKSIKQIATDLKGDVNLNSIERLFFNGFGAYNIKLDDRKTNILHLAVQKCNVGVIENIFKKLKFVRSTTHCIYKNNFINARDIDHWTPLHYAAQRGKSHIVKHLLQNGSIYNAETINCETPLTLTTDDSTKSILQLTEQIFKEINLGTYKEVVNCINKQPEIINAKDKDGNSLLHLAIYHDYMDITESLLRRGAEIDQINEEGNTPLHLASSKDSKNIAENLLKTDNLLYKNKVKKDLVQSLLHSFVNIQAKDGTTALHIAAQHNRIEIVKLLLSSRASYNIKNKEGKCPVDLSTDADIIAIFKFVQELFNDATDGKTEIIEKLQNLNCGEFNMVTAVCTRQRHTLEDILKSNEYESILSEFSKVEKDKNSQKYAAPVKSLATLSMEDSDGEDLGFGLFD